MIHVALREACCLMPTLQQTWTLWCVYMAQQQHTPHTSLFLPTKV